MHPDSPTPPKEKARGDRGSSGAPTWATWQRLDEELPQWDSWSTLADEAPRSDERRDGGAHIKSFRLSDAPGSPERSGDGWTAPQRNVSSGGASSEPSRRAEDAARDADSGPKRVELYNHQPLVTPDDAPAGPRRLGGDGISGDGFGRSPEQGSGDGYARSKQQTSGDGYARTRQQGSGDGYAQPRQQDSGDGYSRPRQQDSGDGYARPPKQNSGDGYARPPQESAGDGYAKPTEQTSGDGYARTPQHRAGDGYARPDTSDYTATPDPEDGRSKGHGDGAAYERMQGDGVDLGAIRSDGPDFGRIAGDGAEFDRMQGDGAESDRLSGDGFSAPAPADDDTTFDEIEEDLEPWNDLSAFTQADPGPATHSPESDPAEDAGKDAGFSALDLRDRVVIMLLFKQVVQIDEVEKAHRRWQKQSGGKSKEPLWRVLTMDPAFDRDKIFAEAAQVYAFKQANIDKASALAFIRKQKDTYSESHWERMRKLRVLPIRFETHKQKKEKRVIFISHDPSRPDVNRLMRELKLENFELQYLPEAEIEALIHDAFPKRNEYLDRVSDGEFAFDLGTSYDKESTLIDEDALEAEISRSSLINLFEAALVEAVRRGVSDIHIFPNPRKQIEIHFRVDGELECWHREERVHPEAFLAVVKDNTLNVDRFERDTAQDGFIQRKVDDTLIRYRVSVLPVANANQEIRSESIVIRVLDDRKVITDLGKLGLLDKARAKFEWAIKQPHGMVILTGPTGSGKTTTLFAALHQVVTPKVNVLTVEDPVEYVIPGVRQIKLSHKLALEQALRSILRHDPDIVMVGEMRDRETAELAIKLANTGHLTFSTLHTNDAPSAVSRLYKMGVEPFLIAYAINLVVAQRLVRKLCDRCKRPAKNLDHQLLLRLGFTQQDLAQARFFDEGHDPECRACAGTGYKGRRAITETMAFSDEIRRRIVLANDMIDEDGLRAQAVSEGMLTLRGSAREVVKQGETSVAELIRVTAGEH